MKSAVAFVLEIVVVLGARLLANSVNEIRLRQVHLLVQPTLAQDLVKRVSVWHLDSQLLVWQAAVKALTHRCLLTQLHPILKLELLECALHAKSLSLRSRFETVTIDQLLLRLLIVRHVSTTQESCQLTCILTEQLLLELFTFVSAAVALHQQILEALSIGALLVSNIGLEELQ